MTSTPTESAEGIRPNIVYLHTHDTGRFVQPYGAPVPMPNLQAFAEEGVLFRHAHSAAPTCSPSRAALLTGQSPHNAGMLGLAHRGFGLTEPRQHIAHTLAGAGYHTAMVGQQHVNHPADPAALGYAEVLPSMGERAGQLLPGVLDFLGRDHDRPFFCSVGLLETHTMADGEGTFGYPGEDDRYLGVPAPLPATESVRSDIASFRAAAKIADDTYGQILAAIDAAGLRDNTVVIITTDHGLPLPGMKSTLTELGTGVLLIMRGPGGFGGGQVRDELVSHVDLFPTLCDLLGIDPPAWLQGTSLLPCVRDDVAVRDEVFTESTFHVSYQPQRCVRTLRHSLISDFGDWPRPRRANVDDSASKAEWVDAGGPSWPIPVERLHDLVLDPYEHTNLVNDPAYVEVLADLRARLAGWMQRTDDPLLRGPVPAAPGFPALPDDAASPAAIHQR